MCPTMKVLHDVRTGRETALKAISRSTSYTILVGPYSCLVGQAQHAGEKRIERAWFGSCSLGVAI